MYQAAASLKPIITHMRFGDAAFYSPEASTLVLADKLADLAAWEYAWSFYTLERKIDWTGPVERF